MPHIPWDRRLLSPSRTIGKHSSISNLNLCCCGFIPYSPAPRFRDPTAQARPIQDPTPTTSPAGEAPAFHIPSTPNRVRSPHLRSGCGLCLELCSLSSHTCPSSRAAFCLSAPSRGSRALTLNPSRSVQTPQPSLLLCTPPHGPTGEHWEQKSETWAQTPAVTVPLSGSGPRWSHL